VTYFALGEIGLVLKPNLPKISADSSADTTIVHKIEPRAPQQQEPPKRRALPNLDLMGLIADSDSKDKKPTPPPAKPFSGDITQPSKTIDNGCAPLFSYPQIRGLLAQAIDSPNPEIKAAGQAAQRLLIHGSMEENEMLSVIEKIIFLKEVP